MPHGCVLQVHLMFDKAIHSLHSQNMLKFATGKLYLFFIFFVLLLLVFRTRVFECHWHMMNRTQFRKQTVYCVEMVYFGSLVLLISRLYPICSHVLCVYICNDKPTLCSLKHPSIGTTGIQWRGNEWGVVVLCHFVISIT